MIFQPSNRIQNNNIASFPANEASSRIDGVTDSADDSSSAVGISSSESNGESSDTDENAFQFFSVNHHVNLQPAHPSPVYIDDVAESDDDVSYDSDRLEEEVYYRAVYDDLAYGIRTAIECFRSKAPRTINVLTSTDPPTIPTLSYAHNNPNLFQVSFSTPYEKSYHYPVLSKVESSSVIDWLVYNLVIARFLDVQLKVAQIMAEDNYIFPDNHEDVFDGSLSNSEDYDSDVSQIDDALYSPILPECLQKLKSSFTKSRKARQVRRRLRQRRNALTIDSEAELREFAAQIRGVPLDSDTDTDSNSDLDLHGANSFDVHAVDAVPAVSTTTAIPIHQDVNITDNATTIASTASVVSTKPTTSTQPTEQTIDSTKPAELYSSYASQSAVERQPFKTESTRTSIPGTLVTLAFRSFMQSGLRSVPQTILFKAAKNAANILVESDPPTLSKQNSL